MPTIYFNQNEQEEQALGGRLNNVTMRVYLIDRNNPNTLISLVGHQFNDAPNYTVTDPLIVPEYIVQNGYNTVRETRVTPEIIKSIDFDVALPYSALPAIQRAKQRQGKCKYDLLFVPENCDSGCDEYYWLGQDVKFNAIRITSGAVGFDDNGAAIDRTINVSITGNLLTFYGLETFELASIGDANGLNVQDIAICNDDCECGCDYTLYLAAKGLLTNGLIGKTTDGGATWTVINSGGGTRELYHEILCCGDRVVFATASLTTTNLGYLTPDETVDYALIDGVDNFGQIAATNTYEARILPINNQLYALHEDVVLTSCDCGLSWTTNPNVTLLGNTVAVDWDSYHKRILIGSDNVGVLEYYVPSTNSVGTVTNNGTPFPAASTITAVKVLGDGYVAVGWSTGEYYEAYDFDGVNGTFNLIGNFDNAITSIAGENNYPTRVLVAEGTNVWRKDAGTELYFKLVQDYSLLQSGVTAVNIIELADRLEDEGDNIYFVGGVGTVLADINVFRTSMCGLCFEGCS